MMVCKICGGLVEWQGPPSELTHTKCINCHSINSQELDSSDNEGLE